MQGIYIHQNAKNVKREDYVYVFEYESARRGSFTGKETTNTD